MNLKLALRAMHVQRWHIVHTTKYQSVAEHHYGVWLIAMTIYDCLYPTPHNSDERGLVAMMALTHDLPEVLLGDTPSSAKEQMTAQELDGHLALHRRVARAALGLSMDAHVDTLAESVVKLADRLEANYYGNHYIPDMTVRSHVRIAFISQFTRARADWPLLNWDRVEDEVVGPLLGRD